MVIGPGIVLGIAVPLLWGHAVTLLDIVLAVVLYNVTGHGITVGPPVVHPLELQAEAAAEDRVGHARLVSGGRLGDRVGRRAPPPPPAQRRARRPALAVPLRSGHARAGARLLPRARRVAVLRGADMVQRYASDLLQDRALVVPAVCSRCSVMRSRFHRARLAGCRNVGGVLTALVWAGLVRMMVLHHITWSINSVCHVFGRQPFTTKDHSTNFAPLAILSFGESWHNFHHAQPCAARHARRRTRSTHRRG